MRWSLPRTTAALTVWTVSGWYVTGFRKRNLSEDIGIMGSAACLWIIILSLILSRASVEEGAKPETTISDVDRWRRMRHTSRRQ
jgi:hypothetical protein